MRFYGEKPENKSDYPPETGYGPNDLSPTDGYGYDEDMPLRCPPHTTERKLVTRIDLHVMPFLCIMYREYNSPRDRTLVLTVHSPRIFGPRQHRQRRHLWPTR
jgi:hypothetical protein